MDLSIKHFDIPQKTVLSCLILAHGKFETKAIIKNQTLSYCIDRFDQFDCQSDQVYRFLWRLDILLHDVIDSIKGSFTFFLSDHYIILVMVWKEQDAKSRNQVPLPSKPVAYFQIDSHDDQSFRSLLYIFSSVITQFYSYTRYELHVYAQVFLSDMFQFSCLVITIIPY